jgi:hypothetical protein
MPQMWLPLALAKSHSALEPDSRPPLQLVEVERFTVVAASHDQHSGSNQLITNMGGRPGKPRTDREPAASASTSS